MKRRKVGLVVPQGIRISRRQVMRGLLGSAAFVTTSKLWTGCTSAPPEGEAGTGEGGEVAADAVDSVVMGFIFVGPKDDYGYNQAHYEGKEGTVAKLEWVEAYDEENVPETTAVEESMRNMIEVDSATVLFPTSFGYFDPYILEIAKEYPEVQFLHCGGLYEEGKHPENVGTYLGYIDEAQYLAGIVAGLSTKTNKLGFVAAKPIPVVLRNVNSFTLGARSVNPTVKTQVIFTGDWAQPVKEAEAANSLVDQNVDVLTCHVDSPKVVIETAEKRGIFASGYHANQIALAPKGYLTGAEWDWTNVYSNYAEMIKSGKSLMNGGIPHMIRGGIKDGFCKMSDFGPTVSDEAKKAMEEAKAKFMDGSMVIYKGELKDNKGNVVVESGKEYKQQDVELEAMDWLVEGVEGSTGA